MHGGSPGEDHSAARRDTSRGGSGRGRRRRAGRGDVPYRDRRIPRPQEGRPDPPGHPRPPQAKGRRGRAPTPKHLVRPVPRPPTRGRGTPRGHDRDPASRARRAPRTCQGLGQHRPTRTGHAVRRQRRLTPERHTTPRPHKRTTEPRRATTRHPHRRRGPGNLRRAHRKRRARAGRAITRRPQRCRGLGSLRRGQRKRRPASAGSTAARRPHPTASAVSGRARPTREHRARCIGTYRPTDPTWQRHPTEAGRAVGGQWRRTRERHAARRAHERATEARHATARQAPRAGRTGTFQRPTCGPGNRRATAGRAHGQGPGSLCGAARRWRSA
ncbi:hypothetical protein SAMN04489713_103348 [Actinomadura madurae]|uniref:Uncharacterized protein n=1 Tax=Actinomadura madurae TaxID=1993 RepID=A0A1I5CRB7_9ACTN|nr:hypothetical protein SAMN04489713_103348 [Actinomadura madurae]